VTPESAPSPPQLSADQQRGYEQIIHCRILLVKPSSLMASRESGKTELYTGAMLHVLAQNPTAQILVLLPENCLDSSVAYAV